MARDYCEQQGMWLIEDNAHGHDGASKVTLIISEKWFSSPRKQLQSPWDDMLNLHGKIVNLKSMSLKLLSTRVKSCFGS